MVVIGVIIYYFFFKEGWIREKLSGDCNKNWVGCFFLVNVYLGRGRIFNIYIGLVRGDLSIIF